MANMRVLESGYEIKCADCHDSDRFCPVHVVTRMFDIICQLQFEDRHQTNEGCCT